MSLIAMSQDYKKAISAGARLGAGLALLLAPELPGRGEKIVESATAEATEMVTRILQRIGL